jgi:plasmid stabilization system protein ParE
MEVVWSAKARVTYFSVLEYLEKNWSETEIIRFSRRTESVIQAIQKNPGIFVCSAKHNNIRRAIIDKNNSFFYYVEEKNNRIYLLTFFDNRQNPDNLKNRVKPIL